MDHELKSSMKKEQQKLNSDLKQFIEKGTKQTILKWKSKLNDTLNDRQARILMTLETDLNKNIEENRHRKVQQRKLLQKRIAAVKLEKSKNTSLNGDLRKILSKSSQIESKINRMLKA